MFSIKEVAEKMNLPASTIRYYDKQGMLPNMHRTESGYRRFSEADIGMLSMIECLKRTNMPIKDIQQFIAWVQEGDASLQQRYDMFVERRQSVQEQIARLQKTLEFIEYKCWYYATALEAGTEAVHKAEGKNEHKV